MEKQRARTWTIPPFTLLGWLEPHSADTSGHVYHPGTPWNPGRGLLAAVLRPSPSSGLPRVFLFLKNLVQDRSVTTTLILPWTLKSSLYFKISLILPFPWSHLTSWPSTCIHIHFPRDFFIWLLMRHSHLLAYNAHFLLLSWLVGFGYNIWFI